MIRDGHIFTVIIKEDGTFTYKVEGEIQYLTEEEMNQLRICIMEAIGVAEELFNIHKKVKP